MGKKTEFKRFDKVETILKPGTVLEGVLKFKKPLKICGSFKGEIESDGVLFVDKEADVQAELNAREIIVCGKVTGNINASERIVLSGGIVRGDLNSSRIHISDGVDFEGRCRMIKDPETIDIFSARVEKLKEIALSV